MTYIPRICKPRTAVQSIGPQPKLVYRKHANKKRSTYLGLKRHPEVSFESVVGGDEVRSDGGDGGDGSDELRPLAT